MKEFVIIVLRKGYGETQMATISITAEAAFKLWRVVK